MAIDRIQQLAKKYMEYDMIQAHTDLPEYPEPRVQLLHTFLSSVNGVSRDYSELYALVTSLVQMGLDTHDLVDASADRAENKEARSRQLKVLAGDYFSSRFYHLLSQAGQIEAVKHLSHAICEVNRLKMNLYLMMKQLKVSAEEYVQHTVDIKMQLFISFSGLLEGTYLKNWPELLHGFTKCEVLHEELARIESASRFRGSLAYWKLLQNATAEEKKHLYEGHEERIRALMLKYNVSAHIRQMLDNHLRQLVELVEQFDADSAMVKKLHHILKPFLHYLTAPKAKVLEEI
jgi:heptaprenyl diphosphate synthase